MTLQSILEKRRAELVEFFQWRFGRIQFYKPLRHATGFRFDRAALSPKNLERMECAALQLGFRAGKALDISNPPDFPDIRRRFYFRNPKRSARLAHRIWVNIPSERSANLAHNDWVNTPNSSHQGPDLYNGLYNTMGFPQCYVLGGQGLSLARWEKALFSRSKKPKGRRPASDPEQLDLALDLGECTQ